MGNKSTNAVPKVDLAEPESDQLAVPVFDIGMLPLELQEMILMKAAVERRLSCETFGEVYAALAPVCRLWLEMLNAGKFYEKVQRQTFLEDPMCRYLRTVQSIPLTGLLDNVTRAVTLGNKLYVVADDGTHSNTKRIFVYDLDDSAVRHEVREKREIVCSNRRPLEINGLFGNVGLIVPCPRTNTLYAIVHQGEDDEITTIVKVNADNGTVLGRLEFGARANFFSLNPSGSYLIAKCATSIFIYDTSTLALMKTEAAADERYFTYAMLFDDSLDSLVTRSTTRGKVRKNKYLVHEDYQCWLSFDQTSEMQFDFFDKRRAERSRKLRAEMSIAADINMISSWYDKARGLLFFRLATVGNNLRVLRITY